MYHVYKGQAMFYATFSVVHTVLTCVCSRPWFKCILLGSQLKGLKGTAPEDGGFRAETEAAALPQMGGRDPLR